MPQRDPAPLLEAARREWGGKSDLWVFGYASLIWRPDFEVAEHRPAKVHGWHRALKMWSKVYRGTPETPGLVCALLSGGSCHGVVLRVPRKEASEVLQQIWQREMFSGIYDPRWLNCATSHGTVTALAFTLSRKNSNFAGDLHHEHYRRIFSTAQGRYGSSLDYARQTLASLRQHGIEDKALRKLLRHADD